MSGKKHYVYVYGTLRPFLGETHDIPGRLYDLGAFPGAIVLAPDCGSTFKAERIEVDDTKLARLDAYEGYRRDDPARSLYIRKPYLDGWIYEYNRTLHDRYRIEHGDWEVHLGGKSKNLGHNVFDTVPHEESSNEDAETVEGVEG